MYTAYTLHFCNKICLVLSGDYLLSKLNTIELYIRKYTKLPIVIFLGLIVKTTLYNNMFTILDVSLST